MKAPDIIHVNWNASDAISDFADAGLRRMPGETYTPAEVGSVLARKIGRMFVLTGWSTEPVLRVALRFVAQVDDTTFDVKNIDTPEFEALVQVATEPTPHVSVPHCDYIFDLVVVESSNSDRR